MGIWVTFLHLAIVNSAAWHLPVCVFLLLTGVYFSCIYTALLTVRGSVPLASSGDGLAMLLNDL